MDEMIEGTLPGKRARGKPRTTWLDNVKHGQEFIFGRSA